MIARMVEATGGVMCDVDVAIANLQNRERRAKRATPWKVPLEIGPNFRVNVVGFIQVRREAAKTWKRCLAKKANKKDEDDELKADTTFVKNNEDQEVIEYDDIIESFKYGSEVIPVSDDTKASYKYNGGPKRMCVLGFAPLKNLPRHILLGERVLQLQRYPDLPTIYPILHITKDCDQRFQM